MIKATLKYSIIAAIAITAAITLHNRYHKDTNTMAFPNSLMTEQPDSPQVTFTDDFDIITRRYQLPSRTKKSTLVADGYAPKADYVDPEYDAKVFSYVYSSVQSYPIMEVTFRKRNTPDAQYEIHNYSFDRPIEQHPSYKTKWSYALYAQDGTTATPAFWSTATDTTDTEGQQEYKWSKSNPGSGWPTLIKAAVKVGVTSYLTQGARVTKRKVYKTLSAANGAQRWVDEVGRFAQPSETFGLNAQDEYWLISDARIVEDQGAYASTVEFLFADDGGWDTDIYVAASIADDGK